MKQILENILLVTLTILVVFLSMGFNVSKMKCDEYGSLYIGSEVPLCNEEKEAICVKDQEKVSCCMLEVEKSCCPEIKDKSCTSITHSMHFDFETVVAFFDFDFKQISVSLDRYFLYHNSCNLKQKLNYPRGVPLSKFCKPELPAIQSFLL